MDETEIYNILKHYRDVYLYFARFLSIDQRIVLRVFQKVSLPPLNIRNFEVTYDEKVDEIFNNQNKQIFIITFYLPTSHTQIIQKVVRHNWKTRSVFLSYVTIIRPNSYETFSKMDTNDRIQTTFHRIA